jgi:hypothetical protein
MPKLSSGTQFALGDVLYNTPQDANFSSIRNHILANARTPSDYYGILEVIEFAPAEAAEGRRRADIQAPDSADVAYHSGKSLLSFLKNLSEVHREEAMRWVDSHQTQGWIMERILRERSFFKAAGMDAPSDLSVGISLHPIPVYEPDHLALRVEAFFPSEDWVPYQSKDGFLRIRPTVVPGISGIQGSLALGNPPHSEDVDAWEASKPAGVWDYWSFLNFATVLGSGNEMNLVFFFDKSTFFDRPNEVVKTIPMNYNEEMSNGILDSLDHSDLMEQWENLLSILKKENLLGDLSIQKWAARE